MACPITGEVRCKCDQELVAVEEPTVKETLRKLFTDHANYTHLYIVNEIYQLPSLKQVTTRLLENQKDIGDAAKSFVGVQSGKELTRLLTEHILTASATVKAAISGDKLVLKKEIDTLFKNASQVAALLGSIAPSIYSKEEFETQFDQHNQYVIDIATLYLKHQYKKTVKTYDAYYNHMLMFSDMVWAVLEGR